MQQSVIQRSFAGGELAPALHARADQVKYTTGLRTCRNFIVRREGGVMNRPGTRFVAACKDNSADHWLLRYEAASEGSSVLIEAGNGYLRFFNQGGPVLVSAVPAYNGATAYVQGDIVLSGGVNYYAIAPGTGNAPPNVTFWYPMPAGNILEIPHGFGAHQFNWVQSGNVITLTHGEAPPAELVYSSLTRWIVRPISTAPWATVVVGGAGIIAGAGTQTRRYVVTAAAADTYEETEASAPIVVAATIAPTEAAPIALSWTAKAGAAEYYVYEDQFNNGVYGFIGTGKTNAFNDTGFVPDFDVTPPIARILFNTVLNYPHVAGYYQQRRFFARSGNIPDGIWGSRIGFHSNFGISSPLQDDDALTFRLVGRKHNVVQSLVGLKTLVALTVGGEWTIGEPKQPLTPSSIPADQETYLGAHDKAPIPIGNGILYIQARGGVINEIKFDVQVEGLAGKDLTVFASHLFEGYTLNRIDFAQSPNSIVWAPRGDGTLLGLTYLPEQDVWGWHHHDTGAAGQFEDVCVVPEPGEDAPYFIVKRTIGGATVRYIERLESRFIRGANFDEDAFFVDCGLSYSGVPVNSFSGLTHLNGQVVAVVADGAVIFDGDPVATNAASFTVAGGVITLGANYSNVHIGIPIRYAEIELLDLDIQGASVRDKKKRVASVTVLLDKSARTLKVGPNSTDLETYALQGYDTAADSFSGQVEINLTSGFTDNGRVFIRQTDPLPITILGVIPMFEMGG